MKKIIAITVTLLMAAGAFAQEGRRLYNKYSDSEGVSAVYISPAMFKLIGQIPELNVDMGNGEKMDLVPLIRSFTGFYMLDISEKTLASELYKEVTTLIDKGKYEMLMEVKDSGDKLRMYTAGDAKTVESFLFIANDGTETQFICLDGAMDRKEIESLIAKASTM